VQNHTGHSEVAWLNGAVVEHGRQLGVPTPANQRLTDVLSRITDGREEAAAWKGQAMRLATLPE